VEAVILPLALFHPVEILLFALSKQVIDMVVTEVRKKNIKSKTRNKRDSKTKAST
jgi:hypothetical protein